MVTRVLIAAVIALVAWTPTAACIPFSVIDFQFGSAQPRGDNLAEIIRVAKKFRNAPDQRVSLVAQSDGSAANLEMARLRASAVKAELVRRGVPALKIDVELGVGANAKLAGDGYARMVILELTTGPTC